MDKGVGGLGVETEAQGGNVILSKEVDIFEQRFHCFRHFALEVFWTNPNVGYDFSDSQTCMPGLVILRVTIGWAVFDVVAFDSTSVTYIVIVQPSWLPASSLVVLRVVSSSMSTTSSIIWVISTSLLHTHFTTNI